MEGQATTALPARPPAAAGAHAGRVDRVLMRPGYDVVSAGANVKAVQKMWARIGHEP